MRVKYMYCTQCFETKPDGVSPQAYSRLSIGATDVGDLVVECNRHGTVIVVKSDEVAQELFKLGSQTCGCGEEHDKPVCH